MVFSGDRKLSLHVLRCARDITAEILCILAIELFAGMALVWFTVASKRIFSWDELVLELNRQFLVGL